MKRAQSKVIFACQECGHQSSKWLGRCPACNVWNSMVEERVSSEKKRGLKSSSGAHTSPTAITEVADVSEKRIITGIGEFDRVLGGGMVPGGVVLVGGDPGIGKSTLLLQALGQFSGKYGATVLYVSGEESEKQIRLRAERLGVVTDGMLVWSETSVEAITAKMEELSPAAVVIDSVQTVYSETIESSPGSVSQVRESGAIITSVAKKLDVPLFLVGHVTKDGAIAGPRVLEHMVDTVLYFEGKSGHVYRILRAVKNRYGSVMEIGVFEMKDSGLREVDNPSEVFLAERPKGASGSSVLASLEGTRTVLVEIQALVSPALFGVPRRTVVGVDFNKVLLLIAVLEKKAGISLTHHDVFVKVTGGLRIDEPAADLAVLAAIVSNFKEVPIDPRTVVFGEVGLAGEVRGVTRADSRIKEAEKLGFERCILPKDNLKGLDKGFKKAHTGVAHIKEALDAIFG
ncbi:MAG: DNA repair protein RadA [Deltaproteobacteria bacterium]|nr:DNA repair protein RadA [Deltaproteobacteria bacterium]